MIKKVVKKYWIIVAILLTVSTTTAYNYFFLVDKPNLTFRIQQHKSIIDGTAGSPFRYRVLVPFLTESIIKLFPVTTTYQDAFIITYGIFDVVCITFLLLTLFMYNRLWFTWDQSLIGVLFIAGTIDMALRDHQFQPWSLLEPAMFTLVLLMIYKKQFVAFTGILFLATLNRETAIFLPLIFLFSILSVKEILFHKKPIPWKSIGMFIGWVIFWGIIYQSLRYIRGDAPQVLSMDELWDLNTTERSYIETAVKGFMFMGFFWLFAIMGYKYANNFIKRTFWIVPSYLVVIFLWGSWHEVRLLMPLYPILIPLGLSYIYRPGGEVFVK